MKHTTTFLPLNASQERMRFLDALDPKRTDLNISCAAELKEPLSTRQLHALLAALIPAFPFLSVQLGKSEGRHIWQMRHESQILGQVVKPEFHCNTAVELAVHYTDFAAAPSDLTTRPPWRVQLVRLEDRCFLLCSFHHAICDGDRSLALFLGALAEQVMPRDKACSPFEPEPVGNAHWAAAEYFAEALENPADLRSVFAPDGEVAPLSRDIILPAETRIWPMDQVEASLLAALRAGMGNLLRDEQIVVGIPCDGVASDSSEFGYFGTPGLALIPPQSAENGDTAFPPEWAVRQSEQAALVGRISYQDLLASPAFDAIENPERLFDILLVRRSLFGLQNRLVSRVFEPSPSRTPYLLTINHWVADNGDLVVRLETTSGLLPQEALEYIAERMRACLAHVTSPSAPKLVEPGDYRVSITGRPSYIRAFLEHAEREANAPAVITAGGAAISYGTMAERAIALSAALRSALGEGPATVAFGGARHSDEITALMGVGLADASFLRLDEMETSRHATQIQAAAVDAIVRPSSDTDGYICAPQGFVASSDDTAGFRIFVAQKPPRAAHAGDAYVVMTSGSTGQPKAIRFPARQLERLIDWHIDQLQDGLRVLQLSSLMHDVAYHEIFAALSAGRCLAFAGPKEKSSPSELVSFIDAEALDRIYLPTVLLDGVARAALARDLACTALCMVTVAGGPLIITDPIREWFTRTGATLANHYGMSETQDITANFMTGDPNRWPERPHVGRPIADADVGIVGFTGSPVPAGVVGRLAVRFDDMAPGQLMVLGDVGYRSTDGNLHVLGRRDRVVKVRGLRLSLDAIEANLCAQELVSEAAAIPAPPNAQRQDPWVFVTGNVSCAGPEQQKALVDTLITQFGGQAHCQLVPIETLPRLKNEKTDYQSLKQQASILADAPSAPTKSTPEPTEVQATGTDPITAAIKKLMPGTVCGENSRLSDLGFDSLGVMALELELAPQFPELTIADFYNHPTVSSLRRHLTGTKPRTARVHRQSRRDNNVTTVSVVGMAGRFPGASDVGAFWQSLVKKRCLIEATPLPQEDARSRFFVPSFGKLGDVDQFDHAFFGMSPAEAYRMDPQMRLFLELCWNALEHSGDASYQENARIGLFAGAGLSTYLLNELEPMRLSNSDGAFREDNTLQQRLGNDRNYLTSTASYRLGFTGPSVTVQAACATSLVAVHYARQALLNNECDIAIAGGVSVIWPEPDGYEYLEGSVRSPNGRCRPFDADADGTVFGNGGGLVVLKRTADAVSQPIRVYAELLGSAVNHDGGRKMNFAAPSSNGQSEVVEAALANAGLGPDDLDFIEAHGTGTVVGDVIEWSSIGASLKDRQTKNPCIIGSAKGNIGHLDEGAGIAGFIKTCLSVSEGCFPGTCHFENLNPSLRANPNMQVLAENVLFDGGRPVIGGVSAFGMGGTNAHAIVRSIG